MLNLTVTERVPTLTKNTTNQVFIRRHPNRKYYMPKQSGAGGAYLNVPDIRDIVAMGKEVQIWDVKSDSDITARTLGVIILDQVYDKIVSYDNSQLCERIRHLSAPDNTSLTF